MKKIFNNHKRILSMVLALIIAFTAIGYALWSNTLKIRAVADKKDAVSFEEFSKKYTLDDKTLFIGTYLIALDALTEEVYERASESMGNYNQYNKYYKSELAGGVWFNIEDAADLSAISSNGQQVPMSIINPLLVTRYIDANGKTIDAKTGESKTAFDDPDPYDLKTLPELTTLYSQYEAMFSENSKGVDKFYFEQLREFFSKNFRDSETNRCDTELRNLQQAYEGLQQLGKTTEAEVVHSLMNKVDASRRAIVYRKLAVSLNGSNNDDYELNRLQMVLSNRSDSGVDDTGNKEDLERSTQPYDLWTKEHNSYTYDEIYNYITENNDDDDINITKELKDSPYKNAKADKEEFKQNDSIISTLYDADSDCKKAYNKYQSEGLLPIDGHLGSAIYKRQLDIISQSEQGYSVPLINSIEELTRLNNISDNVVKEKENELSLIDNEILPECENSFKALATGGRGGFYDDAIAQGANEDGLSNAIEYQGAALDSEMTQLQFMISAKRSRISTDECYSLTLSWIDWTDALYDSVVEDEFASKARQAIGAHKAWLKKQLEQLANEDSSLASETSKLKEQKEELLLEKQKALDSNDLNGAKKIDAKLAELDKKIEEEIEKATNLPENASASAKAAASVGLAGTKEGAINNILNDALEKQANGEDISEELATLDKLGADDAIAEIKGKKGSSGNNSNSNNSSNSNSNNSGNNGSPANSSGVDNNTNNNSADSTANTANTANNNTADSNNTGNTANNNNATNSSDANGNDSAANTDNKDNATDSSDSAGKTDKQDSLSSNSGKNEGGSGTAIAASLSANDINSLISSILGDDFDNLNAQGKVVAAVAVSWLGELGNRNAKQISKNLIERCAQENNKFVYITYRDGNKEYADLKTLANVTGYRYVYKSNGREGTLAKGNEAYSFKSGSKQMEIKASNSSESMSSAAYYKYGSIYVEETCVSTYFGVTVEPIEASTYSALMNDSMNSQAKELLEAFKKGGND